VSYKHWYTVIAIVVATVGVILYSEHPDFMKPKIIYNEATDKNVDERLRTLEDLELKREQKENRHGRR